MQDKRILSLLKDMFFWYKKVQETDFCEDQLISLKIMNYTLGFARMTLLEF
jgi:hypothetical protein